MLAAAHQEAGQELLGAVARHEPGVARVHAAADWMNAHPQLALWLFTVADPPEAAASRADLTARARAALDGQVGTMRLGEMVGLLVLDGHVAIDEDAVR